MPKAKAEIRSLARSHTEAAIKMLSGVMNSRKATPAACVSAAVALLDRGWGKPTVMVAGDSDGEPIRMEQEPIDIRELGRQVAPILFRADAEIDKGKDT